MKSSHVGLLQRMVGNRAVQLHLGELKSMQQGMVMRDAENEEEENQATAGSLTEDAARNAEEEAMMEVTSWQPKEHQDLDIERY